jgi:hypothetical protein
LYPPYNKTMGRVWEMKKLILAGAFALATTAAQAQ